MNFIILPSSDYMFFYQILTPAEFNRLRSSAKPSEARPSRAKRGQRRKAPGSRRRPPSLARASNKSTDASLLAATELVASKLLASAGKRALHVRDKTNAFCIRPQELKLLYL